jgi:CubicO group peptidase (beta-lactamase class C family)
MPYVELDELADAIERYAPSVLDATASVGAVVAIADRTGRVIEKAFGHADLAHRTRMEPTHAMPVGSFSKLYIATAVMQLVEAGTLDLYAPVNSYLKIFQVNNPMGEREVTLLHLLTHRSGLVTDTFDAAFHPTLPMADYLAGELSRPWAREYRRRRLRWFAPVGEKFAYSTFGLAIAAAVVEAVTGENFGEHARRTIVEPLGMTSTAWPDSANWTAVQERCATGYMRFGGWAVPTGRVESGTYAASGLTTTAGDHTRLLVALMNDGTAYGTALLSPASVREMLAPHVSSDPSHLVQGVNIGLTVKMGNVGRPDFHAGHTGSYPFSSWCESRAYLDLGFAITVCTNTRDGVSYYNPLERTPAGIIPDFAAEFVAAGRGSSDKDAPGRTGSPAYAMGLMVAERFLGLLGIDGDIPEEVLAGMRDGARPIGNGTTPEWSPEEFTAGVRAMQKHVGSPEEIRAFLASPECEVAPEDLRLLVLRWGASRAEDPLPLPFFSERAEEQDRYRHLRDIGRR